MRQINIPYTQIIQNFLEAIRKIEKSENETADATAYREGSALIDPKQTHLNFDLIPHHPALKLDGYTKPDRDQNLKEYHKSVTGRYPRMNGSLKQQSKAVGCIITLPRDYLNINNGLTEKEFLALEKYIETEHRGASLSSEIKSAVKKITKHEYTEGQIQDIEIFFKSALKAWQKNAGIRDEDMLYAVVHLDESQPHLHIAALPTCEISSSDAINITFSVDKFNNYKTHYFDKLHSNIIELMREDGIDASGLLNGATKEHEFEPKDKSRTERKKGVIKDKSISFLNKKKEALKEEISKLNDIKKALLKDLQELKKEILLTKNQSDKLKNNKGILGLPKGKKTTVTVSYEEAVAIKASRYEYRNLEKERRSLEKEKASLDIDRKNFNKIVKDKVIESMPEVIRDFQTRIIPNIKKKAEEQKKKEQELKEQERINKEQAEEIRKKQENLTLLINQEAEKRLAKELRDKLNKVFNMINFRITDQIEGNHQEALFNNLLKVKLPKNLEVGGIDYGKKTLEDALEEARRLDIVDAFHTADRETHSALPTDFRKLEDDFYSGESLEDTAKKVTKHIIDDDLEK